jgi:hypothetical protein
MIYLEDDAVINYAGKELKVTKGGEYEDQELVEVYASDDPSKLGIYALQAIWIATGRNAGEEQEQEQEQEQE